MTWLSAAIGLISLMDKLPPGIHGKLNTIQDWVSSALAWGGGIAFIVVGGIFCYSYFGGHGSSKAVRALAGVSVGCVLISAGGAISDALLA